MGSLSYPCYWRGSRNTLSCSWLLLGRCSVSVFSLPRHFPPLLRDFCNSSLRADASLAAVVVETSSDHAQRRGLKEESGAYAQVRSPIHSFANQDYCQYPRQSGEPSPFALVKYSTPSGEPFHRFNQLRDSSPGLLSRSQAQTHVIHCCSSHTSRCMLTMKKHPTSAYHT